MVAVRGFSMKANASMRSLENGLVPTSRLGGEIYDDPGRSGSSPIRSFTAFVRFVITVRL
jgi:hypothetical protein